MGTPPRLNRISTTERREAVRDAKALATAYDLSPPAAAAVCYALTNHGDWPWPHGGNHSAEVLQELHTVALAELYGPDNIADKLRHGRGPALPADAVELACAWLPYRLQGIPPEQWPRLLAFDLVEWRQLARAYRAVAEVQTGRGSQ